MAALPRDGVCLSPTPATPQQEQDRSNLHELQALRDKREVSQAHMLRLHNALAAAQSDASTAADGESVRLVLEFSASQMHTFEPLPL